MHYGSWIPQTMLDNHRYYPQYIEDPYRIRSDHRDEENEQTGDDTLTTATSGERSSSADIFRLEFAATQWSKLVSNAEGLFNKLVASNVLPHNEQDQVEQWLCMKQEYEECIGSDESSSVPGYAENTRRSLERIEEVTETDERTDESGNPAEFRNISDSCTSSSCESEMSEEADEENESDVSSENPDFMEKLDECMNKFKLETDKLIDEVEDGFREKGLPIISACAYPINNNNDYVPIVKPIPIRNPNSRRNSMLPGSEMCNEVIIFNGGFKPPQKRDDCHVKTRNINDNRVYKHNSPDVLVDALKSNDTEPIRTLKTLTMNNEAKQNQVKIIQLELDKAHKRIDELQTTIRKKEKFIADMEKNTESRNGGKQKIQRKRLRVKKEYTRWAAAEKTLCRNTEDLTSKREFELCKNMAIDYEKRLLDIEEIRQIAGESAKKVQELETSLNSSKKQMEKLQKQLKKEEERKNLLESELAEDQKKIRELEEKYNLTESKLQEMRSESEDERAHSRALSEQDKNNMMLVSSRISQIDCVLKEKSMDLEKASDSEEKQALRHEIQNLRRTKDRLVEQKCGLDGKLLKEKTLTTDEQRKRLECGETIEMIDAMIEHKNERICGRKNFNKNDNQNASSEKVIIDKHLSRLSEPEMKKLFYAYFRKVIDLKESSRNLEVLTNELEATILNQEAHTRSRLNQQNERFLRLEKEYEHKINSILRHYRSEAGTTRYDRLDRDSEYMTLKKENRALKKQLAHYDVLLRGNAITRATSPHRIQQLQLKQIAPPPPENKTTTVTRKKNKLIIQKTDK